MSEIIHEFGYEYDFKTSLTNLEENALKIVDVFYRELARSVYYDGSIDIEPANGTLGCKITIDGRDVHLNLVTQYIKLFAQLVKRLQDALNNLELPVLVSFFENRVEVSY